MAPVTQKVDHARNELVEAFKRLYFSKQGADITVICGPKSFSIHSVIICCRSDFFAAACKGGFKEAKTHRIELPEDKPWLVARMCQYFYALGYDEKKCLKSLGDKDESYISPIHMNVHMYAMGDKFGIKGLKALAAQKFEAAYGAANEAENQLSVLLPIIADIYSTTPENDRGLRSKVVTEVSSSLQRLSAYPEFNKIMTMVPEFAVDLLLQVAPKSETRFCRKCTRCCSTDKWKVERVRCSCGWGENVS